MERTCQTRVRKYETFRHKLSDSRNWRICSTHKPKTKYKHMVAINNIQKAILVFKTNIRKQQKATLINLLSTFNDIFKIDFDFEDVDNIMRVEAMHNISPQIQFLMNVEGFVCQ